RHPAGRRRLGRGRRTLLCAVSGVGTVQGHPPGSNAPMLRSMTGFGAGDLTAAAGHYVVEARALNHRFLEVVVRLPRDLASLEDRVRSLVQGRILRGRVEIAIMRENYGKRARTVKVDIDLAKTFISALNDLKPAVELAGTPDLTMG